MKDTGYDRHDVLIPRRASGYSQTANGYANAAYLDMSIPYAAGSLYSTVEDLYLWDQVLYTDKLLTSQSKELMYKPFLQEYAYGWVVTNASFKLNDQPVPVITHDGGINGFTTTIVRFPREKHLIVLLDNTGSPNLAQLSDKLAKILYGQPYDPPKMSIAAVVEKTITEKGIDGAVAEYRELKTKQSATYDFSEPQLNSLGYRLMQTGKLKEAVEIFKLNVEAYPQAFNPYDSLAEAYMNLNERELAIKNYKKSVELNPKNTGAIENLKKLENPAAKVDANTFDAYVGEYELAPGFVLRVFREGEKLMTQATGQNQIEIFAEADGSFTPRTFPAKLTFIKGDDGKVTSVKLTQGGRETFGKKIK
jgi:tetratricopeptide (TPR) repeat protein